MLQLVGVTTSVWTMDTLGRRKLLLDGSVLMAISHIVIAILVGLFSSNWESIGRKDGSAQDFYYSTWLLSAIHGAPFPGQCHPVSSASPNTHL